jgi:hypothetical protein
VVNRQKNLLEAFTASANAEKAASEDPSVPGSPSGGPFAPGPGREDAIERSSSSLADTLLHPENRGGLIALMGVLITLAFLAGRMTIDEHDETLAAAPAEPAPTGARPARTETPRTPAPAAAAAVESEPDQPITPAEKALADTRNRYTIKLIEYADKKRDEDLAWNLLNYLEDKGYAAASLFKGNRLFVVVGAAPNQVDLDGDLDRLRALAGPPPMNREGEFSTAYVEKIENLYTR